jgi:YegS/Rv2252/BmrU family lipid kinase
MLQRAAPRDVDFGALVTPAKGTTTDLARGAVNDGATMVVAVGGDGTVAEVAEGLVGSEACLGIVPGGSTNVTARSLGIPINLSAAIALLFNEHRDQMLNMGRCGDHYFLHMAGAGLDSRMLAGSNPSLKRRLGWPAYLPPAIRDLSLPPANFTIVADGVETRTVSPMVVVANGSTLIAPHVSLDPSITPNHRQFDVLIFTATRPLAMARTVARVATHGLQHSPFVTHMRASEVQVVADPVLPVEVDGNVVLQTPQRFELIPEALRVAVP